MQPRPSVPIPRLIAWSGGGGAPNKNLFLGEFWRRPQDFNADAKKVKDFAEFVLTTHLRGERRRNNRLHSLWLMPSRETMTVYLKDGTWGWV